MDGFIFASMDKELFCVVSDLADRYVASTRFEEDFNLLKPRDRVSCLLRLLPYFAPRENPSKSPSPVQLQIDFDDFLPPG